MSTDLACYFFNSSHVLPFQDFSVDMFLPDLGGAIVYFHIMENKDL